MIKTIERIIKNGHGYIVDSDVYFHVPSLPNYGRLSGRAQEDNRCAHNFLSMEAPAAVTADTLACTLSSSLIA
jgi:cysteinyl-tRNA synthetase